MSGQWNSETQRYEVFSTLEGGMVPTGSNRPFYNPFNDSEYCGYCKCSPCQCDGHGGSHTPTCGYCHSPLDEEHNTYCDGFGHDPETGEDLPAMLI